MQVYLPFQHLYAPDMVKTLISDVKTDASFFGKLSKKQNLLMEKLFTKYVKIDFISQFIC